MTRLFVAVDLPEDVKDRLEDLCQGVAGARWMRDRQFHVTLAFLGDLAGPDERRLSDGLHAVRCEPFELSLRGIGHFPPRGTPKVLWVGVRAPPQLGLLHQRIQSRLARLDLPTERRKYAPHVTLARLRDAPLGPLVTYMEGYMGFQTQPFLVSEFRLFSSVLGRTGAQHRIEQTYPLRSAEQP